MRTPHLILSIALVLLIVLVSLGIGGTGKGRRQVSKQASGKLKANVLSASGYTLEPVGTKEIKRLAKGLSKLQRQVLLEEGTERAFTGELLENKQKGLYACRLCGLPLFKSDAKFDSGTGWPSFFRPFDPGHVAEKEDDKFGVVRIETECARCGSHLGHVFDDGPKPTGLRYCMNSAALRFHKAGAELPRESRPAKIETAYFAGGCFWGIEDRFQNVSGVIDAVSGYQGGRTDKPSYREVCSGSTGHAESVLVKFDANRVSYRQLLEAFFKFHDPTQKNRQGLDIGTQYRSAIFTVGDKQLAEARAFIKLKQESKKYSGRKIETIIQKATPFFEAEAYHQDYHARKGGSCAVGE